MQLGDLQKSTSMQQRLMVSDIFISKYRLAFLSKVLLYLTINKQGVVVPNDLTATTPIFIFCKKTSCEHTHQKMEDGLNICQLTDNPLIQGE